MSIVSNLWNKSAKSLNVNAVEPECIIEEKVVDGRGRLEVEIEQHENILVGRIISQPETLRGSDFPFYSYDARTILKIDNYKIESNRKPKLDDKTLSIRGYEKQYDNLIFCYSYDSAEKAEEAKNMFIKLVGSLNCFE